ncbi:MAG: helix-turn-helix transcriptional regulator, partial [Candidatus Eremiobacteraeota bacterium]|nr:helix-turn-helix transcriptional regulator [Candidatus Eremiobacteraeota bacterium]
MAKGRTKMIEAAARLIHKQGYHATGLAEVVDKSGAPRGSIYHYFPRGKNQLVEEAIEAACLRLVGYLEPL